MALLPSLSGCYKQVQIETEGYKGSTNTTLIEKHSNTNAAKLWKLSNKMKSNFEKNINELCPDDPQCTTQRRKLRLTNTAIKLLNNIQADETNFRTIHYSYIVNNNIPWPKRIAYCLNEQMPAHIKDILLPATRNIDAAFLAHQGSAPPQRLVIKLDKAVCEEFEN